MRRQVGIAHAQRPHVVEIMLLEPLRDHLGRNPFRRSRLDDLVVDVGDVAGIDEAIRAKLVPQQPRERVEHHRGPGIADVRAAINRRPADIHGDALGIGGLEVTLRPRGGVVKADHFIWFRCSRASLQVATIARPLASSSG